MRSRAATSDSTPWGRRLGSQLVVRPIGRVDILVTLLPTCSAVNRSTPWRGAVCICHRSAFLSRCTSLRCFLSPLSECGGGFNGCITDAAAGAVPLLGACAPMMPMEMLWMYVLRHVAGIVVQLPRRVGELTDAVRLHVVNWSGEDVMRLGPGGSVGEDVPGHAHLPGELGSMIGGGAGPVSVGAFVDANAVAEAVPFRGASNRTGGTGVMPPLRRRLMTLDAASRARSLGLD